MGKHLNYIRVFFWRVFIYGNVIIYTYVTYACVYCTYIKSLWVRQSRKITRRCDVWSECITPAYQFPKNIQSAAAFNEFLDFFSSIAFHLCHPFTRQKKNTHTKHTQYAVRQKANEYIPLNSFSSQNTHTHTTWNDVHIRKCIAFSKSHTQTYIRMKTNTKFSPK